MSSKKLGVDFLYGSDCPNIKAAREQLIRAFDSLGLVACWREWDLNSKDAPCYTGRSHATRDTGSSRACVVTLTNVSVLLAGLYGNTRRVRY